MGSLEFHLTISGITLSALQALRKSTYSICRESNTVFPAKIEPEIASLILFWQVVHQGSRKSSQSRNVHYLSQDMTTEELSSNLREQR